MKNGHNLIVYAIPLLETLGYKRRDIRYVHNGNIAKKYPRPDYLIKDKIAVEVGKLSEKTKIKDLLKIYDKVIWILMDQKFPLLSCIVYDKGVIVLEEKIEIIREPYEKEIFKLKDSVKDLKKDLIALSNQNITLKNRINVAKSIMQEGFGFDINKEYKDYNVSGKLIQNKKGETPRVNIII